MRGIFAFRLTVAFVCAFAFQSRAEDSSAPQPVATEQPNSPNANSKQPVAPASDRETAVATSVAPSVVQSPPVTLVVKADLAAQTATVIEGSNVLYVWPISSGVQGYLTPTGTFQPTSANKIWYSRQYDWTPMPHAVFFNKGVAFHGTNATGRLGKAASHGCIRLANDHAQQLFELVHKHGFAQTRIVVFGSAKQDAPTVAKRDPAAQPSPEAYGRSKVANDWMAPNFWNRP